MWSLKEEGGREGGREAGVRLVTDASSFYFSSSHSTFVPVEGDEEEEDEEDEEGREEGQGKKMKKKAGVASSKKRKASPLPALPPSLPPFLPPLAVRDMLIQDLGLEEGKFEGWEVGREGG